MSIKQSFVDIGNLYKNFLHWNISKISIFIFSLLLAIAITIPVVLLGGVICWILGVDWVGYVLLFLNGTLQTSQVFSGEFFIFGFFAFIGVITFFLSLAFGKIMYFDLNLHYLENKKAEYIKTKFFRPKLFLKFFSISAYGFLYLLIPFAIALIWSGIILAFNGGVNNVWVALTNGSQALAISFLLVAIVSICIFVYLSYRLYFSYIGLIDETKYSELQPAKTYVKDSLEITKWWKKPMKLVVTLFLFALIVAPYTFVTQAFENTFNDMSNYEKYQLMWEETKLQVIQQNPYFQGVIQQYKDVSMVDLQRNIAVYNYLLIFMSVIGFLLIQWVTEMIMVSHYKQIQNKNNID